MQFSNMSWVGSLSTSLWVLNFEMLCPTISYTLMLIKSVGILPSLENWRKEVVLCFPLNLGQSCSTAGSHVLGVRGRDD